MERCKASSEATADACIRVQGFVRKALESRITAGVLLVASVYLLGSAAFAGGVACLPACLRDILTEHDSNPPPEHYTDVKSYAKRMQLPVVSIPL